MYFKYIWNIFKIGSTTFFIKTHLLFLSSNLNGQYLEGGKFEPKLSGRGITWMSWRGYDYGYKFAQMMIRPKCSNNLKRQPTAH